MKKHRAGPSPPAGRRLFEEGRICGTGRLRRPSKPTYQDDSLGARTAEDFFKWGGGVVVLDTLSNNKKSPKNKSSALVETKVGIVSFDICIIRHQFISVNIFINCA